MRRRRNESQSGTLPNSVADGAERGACGRAIIELRPIEQKTRREVVWSVGLSARRALPRGRTQRMGITAALTLGASRHLAGARQVQHRKHRRIVRRQSNRIVHLQRHLVTSATRAITDFVGGGRVPRELQLCDVGSDAVGKSDRVGVHYPVFDVRHVGRNPCKIVQSCNFCMTHLVVRSMNVTEKKTKTD
jgi:hypothetical protein